MKKNITKLTAFLLIAAFAFLFTACTGSGEDETTTTEPTVTSKTEMPTTVAEIIAYFNAHMNELKTEKTAMTLSRKQDLSNFDSGENKDLKALFPTLKGYMLANKGDETKYGESLKDRFPVKGQDWVSGLSTQNVRLATCSEVEKTYVITIRFNDEVNPELNKGNIGKIYDMPDFAAIRAEFDKAKAAYQLGETIDTNYTGCVIRCVINRETDQIISVKYSQNIDVTTTIIGTGKFESWGTVPVKFRYSQNDDYSFNWVDPDAPTTTVAS